MHTLIMQVHEGPQLKVLLDYLRTFGAIRVVFPGREYESESKGAAGADEGPFFETARLMPFGHDGGFAENFLRERGESP